MSEQPTTPAIVDAHGKPAAKSEPTCPGCQKVSPRGDTRARCLSGGFGQVHDVCTNCGWDWDELTIPMDGKA